MSASIARRVAGNLFEHLVASPTRCGRGKNGTSDTRLGENDLFTAAADEIRQEDPNRVVELVLELDEILKTVWLRKEKPKRGSRSSTVIEGGDMLEMMP